MVSNPKETRNNRPKPQKTGRRGKYHEWITEEGLLQVEQWAAEGLIDDEIMMKIGIASATYYDWQNRFPEFREAIKKGKAPVDFKVEKAMLKRALGYDVDDNKTIVEVLPNGSKKQRVEKSTRHVPGDTTAQIFWLKNRMPDRWRDVKQNEISGSIEQKVANPFEGLTTEELKQLIDDE